MIMLDKPANSLQLYNTLTRRKERFEPIDASNVRLYGCGPTVYDYAHVGNARAFLSFDILFRLLRHLYGAEHVTFVRNITDIDDKINARAQEEGTSIRELTERTYAQFRQDMDALGLLHPTHEPRATDYIAEMSEMIERLVENGHAYVADEHVLFDVPSMRDYGALSRRTGDELEAGARVEVESYKRDAQDFVLWKPSKAGEPAWPSPCGIATPGRPGWHIECSAMSAKLLGEIFDIHAGGIDLVFPHHENEIAQSRCAHGTPVMARYWVHNGFLNVEGEKMSKSLGNFITAHDLLQDWPGEAIRLFMFATHYRQPMNLTRKGIGEAKRALDHWYELTAPVEEGDHVDEAMLAALCDDLNTPKALASLHELRKSAANGDKKAARSLKASARLLGLLQQWPEEWAAWRPASVEIDAEKIDALIAARKNARAEKNWAEADRIRDELTDMGVTLKDTKDKGTGEIVTTWEVAR